MRAITRSYLVELYFGTIAPGQGAQFTFQDYPELKEVWITGVEVVSGDYLSIAPSGRVNTASANLPGLVLNLLDINTNIRVYNYPTFDLQPNNVGGFYRDFVPFRLNLVKSFVTVFQNIGINANESLCFNFLYIRKDEATRAGLNG